MLVVMFTAMAIAQGATPSAQPAPTVVRIATFNIWELSREKLDRIDAAGVGIDEQLRGAARIIQLVRPDVLLINEIDHDDAGENIALFQTRYLNQPQGGAGSIDYPHVYFQPVNTGVPSGRDLDHDGESDGPGDGFGFGRYPGQYGMALQSRFPIDTDSTRTFRLLRWADMPGNLMPDGTGGKPDWFSADDAEILRLSSKSHWDAPVRIGDTTLHCLCSHPTPPAFDGDEDRNGRRNFDEVRFWADYLSGGRRAEYIVDDAGRRGGLDADAVFVILGDLNADPYRDPSPYGCSAISQLLDHPRVIDFAPSAQGALMGELPGPPTFLERRTCEFGRIDYVLLSDSLSAPGRGVFWPGLPDTMYPLVADREHSSDHRLVWVDLMIPQSAHRAQGR